MKRIIIALAAAMFAFPFWFPTHVCDKDVNGGYITRFNTVKSVQHQMQAAGMAQDSYCRVLSYWDA